VATRDCPNKARKTTDQRVPGLLVSPCSLAQESAKVDGIHIPTLTTPHLDATRRAEAWLGHNRDIADATGAEGQSKVETGFDLFVACHHARGLGR
jgi:hypothetical protein